MKTWTATPEEFATGRAATKAVDLFRNRNRKSRVAQPAKPAKPAGIDRQIGTITPEQFGRGDAYWVGRRRQGHRTKPSEVIKPMDEARLPDLLLDLADYYGNAFPRPRGNTIQFSVIDDNVTYEKAKARIEALLNKNGVLPSSLTITPGPEVAKPWNRKIVILLARDVLM